MNTYMCLCMVCEYVYIESMQTKTNVNLNTYKYIGIYYANICRNLKPCTRFHAMRIPPGRTPTLQKPTTNNTELQLCAKSNSKYDAPVRLRAWAFLNTSGSPYRLFGISISPRWGLV